MGEIEMTYIERTLAYKELFNLNNNTLRDIYIKYGLMADVVIGASDKKLIEHNYSTYRMLLNPILIDFVVYQYESGGKTLNSVKSQYPNLSVLLDIRGQNNCSLYDVCNKYKKSGWEIPEKIDIQSIESALNEFGLPEADSLDNAEVVENQSNSNVPDIDFDDNIDFSDIFGPDEEFEQDDTEKSRENLFNHADENSDFDVAVKERFLPDEVGDIDEYAYDDKIVREEKNEASKNEANSNKLDESDVVEDWAYDNYGDSEDIDKMPFEVDGVITSIINRISGVMQSCFELDKPYGVISKNGLISYHKDKKKGTLVLDSAQSQNGNSEMEILYKTIVDASGVNIVPAIGARYIANYKNITGKSSKPGTELFNYYPGQMLKYALGFVNGKRHTTWKVFEKELRESLKHRLNEFFKHKDENGNNEYYKYRDKFVEIYSNCLLVLSYSPGGITIRASIIGMDKNIENNIKSRLSQISIMSNSSITVYPVKGTKDVVDIQIISDLKTVLGKPSWAYKALKIKLDNNEAPSLLSGLPIGRKLNGEIVEHSLDPSSGFLMFMAAGSGSGKGVMTLSLTAAALGSGIPLFYTDYKPDMAPIFWEMADKLNTEMYSFDANVKYHKNNPNSGFELGGSIPKYVYEKLNGVSGAFLYLRSLALMCAMADYRAQFGVPDNGLFFVFDEIQAMQRLIFNAISKVQELFEENKPNNKNEGNKEIYEYCKSILEWAVSVDAALDKYTVTTGRTGAVYSLFIGQNATAGLWDSIIPTVKLGKSGKQLPFMSRLLKCGTVVKFMGKGTTSSNYGLGGANITKDELTYISEYRFFSRYTGPEAGKADVTVFKPFLTLNYDDIFERCWTNGVGKIYGYQSPGKNATREQMIDSNKKYIENMQESFPGEPGYTNEFGVHPGVGLLGLASMYCNGDINKLAANLKKSIDSVTEFFNNSNLSSRYSDVTSYMYDMSESSWITQERMIRYDPRMDKNKFSYDQEEKDTGLPYDIDELKDQDKNENNSYEEGTFNEGWHGVDHKTKQFSGESTINEDDIDNIYIDGFDDEYEDKPDPDFERSKNDKGTGENSSDSFDKGDQSKFRRGLNGILNRADDGNFEGYSKAPNGEYMANKPTEMPPLDESMFSFGGTGNSTVFITPEQTSKIFGLTKENSIVAILDKNETTQKFRSTLFKTLWGSKYEFKCRWKSILDSVAGSMNPSLVKRVIITEDAIVFNNKQIATVDIIGGEYDIRIEDIVNFGMTASRFVNISDIIIDTTILEAAQIEFGNVIDGMFKVFKNLNNFAVLSHGYKMVDTCVTREQYNQNKIKKEVAKEIEKAAFKNQIETVAAAKNPRLSKKRPGYQNRVYESCIKFQGEGWGSAKEAIMSKNPKLFKAAGMTLLTTAVLGIGLVAGAVGKTINLFRR